jgi:hypothetical protein
MLREFPAPVDGNLHGRRWKNIAAGVFSYLTDTEKTRYKSALPASCSPHITVPSQGGLWIPWALKEFLHRIHRLCTWSLVRLGTWELECSWRPVFSFLPCFWGTSEASFGSKFPKQEALGTFDSPYHTYIRIRALALQNDSTHPYGTDTESSVCVSALTWCSARHREGR